MELDVLEGTVISAPIAVGLVWILNLQMHGYGPNALPVVLSAKFTHLEAAKGFDETRHCRTWTPSR